MFSNVLGGDAIESTDLGLRNIERVMGFIVPATTQTGEGYDRLSEMYEALIQQRHRELVYVGKLIGGVEETRYQAGRGSVPFTPVKPDRQRQAARFLTEHAFVEPKRLLDPEVLDRITPSGGDDPLQGSNVDLLRRLIDPQVFRRMMEASNLGNGRYTGLELLSDLNDGLFSELAAPAPVISAYRRQVQRSYVTILLTATGTVADPSAASAHIEGANIDGASADSGVKRELGASLRGTRAFDSTIAKVGESYGGSVGSLSEYRAVLRAAVADLYRQIDESIARTKETDTLLHLRLIRAELGNVP